jgi:hypothetical protein
MDCKNSNIQNNININKGNTKMKLFKYILALFLFLPIMSYSQNVTKLTEYDYLMGTASNTWFYKLNASIDSLNKFIDTLQVHRAMLYENLFMYNDSASLALVADAMYARSGGGGGGIPSDSLDAVLSLGIRAISSVSRMYVSDDSITFTRINGDAADCALGNVFRGTLDADDTLTISNMVDGQIVSIVVTNAGTHTLAWSGVNWSGGTAPTLSAVANKRDVFTLIRAGGIVYGSAVQDMR